MAPKTRGDSSSAAGMKRKRTVRRPTREPTPESSPNHSSDHSDAPTASTPQVDLFGSRVVTTGRKFDFDLFEREGLIVGSQIKEMGFEKICSLDCPTYPSLVKEFYKNLTRGDNGLVSLVRGKGLNVTATILSRLLDLPMSGPSSFESEDRTTALSRLLNRNFEEFEEVHANLLSLDLRLLHNICSRILFPKTGRFDYVSERDIFIMDAVVRGSPINLPTMIIWYMADCGSKKKSSLPYGMILTQIFRSQGIMISDSEPRKNLRHTDYYSLATIHRMGFKKVDGIWIRKTLSEVRAEDQEAPGPSVRQTSPIHPAPAPIPDPVIPSTSVASSSDRFSDAQMEQLRAMFIEIDNQRKEELNELKVELSQFKDDIMSRLDLLSFSIGTKSDSLNDKLQEIFDRLHGIAEGSNVYLDRTGVLRRDIDFAVDQIQACMDNFKKSQKDEILELIGHIKRIVYKHV